MSSSQRLFMGREQSHGSERTIGFISARWELKDFRRKMWCQKRWRCSKPTAATWSNITALVPTGTGGEANAIPFRHQVGVKFHRRDRLVSRERTRLNSKFVSTRDKCTGFRGGTSRFLSGGNELCHSHSFPVPLRKRTRNF